MFWTVFKVVLFPAVFFHWVQQVESAAGTPAQLASSNNMTSAVDTPSWQPNVSLEASQSNLGLGFNTSALSPSSLLWFLFICVRIELQTHRPSEPAASRVIPLQLSGSVRTLVTVTLMYLRYERLYIVSVFTFVKQLNFNLCSQDSCEFYQERMKRGENPVGLVDFRLRVTRKLSTKETKEEKSESWIFFIFSH